MSTNGKQSGGQKRTLQPLRGKRPPHVEGEMRRRHLINELDRWAKEDKGTWQKEKESWETVKEGLRHT